MKKRQIFIELTSLLDVILIMLFMVMVQAENKTAEAVDSAKKNETAYEELSEAYAGLQKDVSEKEEEIGRLSEELEEANRLLLSRDLVTENSDILTVSIMADRKIALRSETRPLQTIAYDWEAPNYAANRFTAALEDWVREAKDKSLFLVFQFDREEIYYNEYEMIKSTVQDLKLDLKKQGTSFYYIELDTQSGT